jgi:hypothetical protein
MSDGFNIDFKALPPHLQVRLWVLSLDANTSRVAIAHRHGAFTTSVNYAYGGAIGASFAMPQLTLGAGVNPGNADLSGSLVFRGFNFGVSGNIARQTVNGSLSYGAALLPFPNEMADVFNAANGGLQSMIGDIRNAPNNPLAWYGLHSNDIGTVSSAVSMGQRIAKAKPGFGARLGLGFAPATGLTITLGAGVMF